MVIPLINYNYLMSNNERVILVYNRLHLYSSLIKKECSDGYKITKLLFHINLVDELVQTSTLHFICFQLGIYT